MDLVVNACLTSVIHRHLESVFVHVGTNDLQINIADDLRLRVCNGLLPLFFCKLRPIGRSELSINARSDLHTNHRGFDRYRSRSAKRIDKDPFRLPDAQINQCRSQRFLDWSPTSQFAISAFVQTVSSGIKRQRGDVFEQSHVDLVERSSFWQFVGAVPALQTLDDSLFYGSLNRRHAGQC